jgi:hypothetical protein
MKKKEVVFYYRGEVERWSMGDPASMKNPWHRGYSEDGHYGGVTYPWRTKSECRKEATARGLRAVFVEERKP